MILRLVLAFIGTASGAVLFGVPRRVLWACGLVGVVAWATEAGLEGFGLSSVAATFVAALAVALVAEILARLLRLPSTCIAVPGFIPLAPGISAYDAMYHFVTNDSLIGNTLAVKAILIAAAIAAGLAIAESIFRLHPIRRARR